MHRIAFLIVLILSGVAGAQTTRPAPVTTRVTVKIDAPLGQAVSQFSEQAKFPLQLNDNRAASNPVKIDMADAPIVSVLAELFRQGKCMPNRDYNTQAMGLSSEAPVAVQVIDERSLLVVRSVQMNGNTSPGGQPNYDCQVDSMLVFDPSMKVIGLLDRGAIESADGVEVRRQFRGNQPFQRADGRPLVAHNLSLYLSSPRRIEKLEKLSLTLSIYQLVDAVELSLTNADLVNGGKSEKDGYALVCEPMNEGNRGIQLRAEGAKVGQMRQHYVWAQSLAGFLRADGGSGALPWVRSNVSGFGEDRVTMRLDATNNQPLIDEIETVYLAIPTKIRQVNVPITIDKLPLP